MSDWSSFTEDKELFSLMKTYEPMLTELFIVSICELKEGNGQAEGAEQGVELQTVFVKAEKSGHPKCERCWNLRTSVGEDKEHETLCARCAGAVK